MLQTYSLFRAKSLLFLISWLKQNVRFTKGCYKDETFNIAKKTVMPCISIDILCTFYMPPTLIITKQCRQFMLWVQHVNVLIPSIQKEKWFKTRVLTPSENYLMQGNSNYSQEKPLSRATHFVFSQYSWLCGSY